jgi:quercetin dioxygenase-like cupin family protein
MSPAVRPPMRRRTAAKPRRFVTSSTARIEHAPWGKHWWLSEPELTGTALLTLVRVTMRSGTGHRFHYHPAREEIIYVVEGVAEQWVDREKQRLKAGECAFIPRGVVHAIYNSSKKPMTFLAILSPATAPGPFLVDCYDDEPWRSLRGPSARKRRSRRRTR